MKKVALVTGSSKGIGKGIAQLLLENNYIVYINGRDKEQVQTTIAQFNCPFAKPLIEDLTNEASIKSSIEYILNNESKIDLIVCNIGTGKSQSGLESEIQEYKRMFDINFFNSVSVALNGIKSMKETGGNIIFISSIAGCEAIGAPIAYSSAKTALLSFAKNLSNEVAQYNIRVNSISPGNVMFEGSTWDDKFKQNKNKVDKYIKENVPLNKFATPNDIAKSVLFLEQNEFITGVNLVIDGGQLNKLI